MLRLIVGALLLVPALAVIALALFLDDAPPIGGSGLASGTASVPGGTARGIVNVQATIELPSAFPRRYLNIDLDAERTVRGGLPSIRRAAVGAVDVSGWLAERTIRWASDRWPVLKDERLERAAARALEWYPDRLELVCAWPRSPVGHMRIRTPSGDGAGGTGAYAERIADWAAVEPGSAAPVLGLLRSLVREAAERTAAGADPVAENRTAILLAAAQGFGCTPVAVGRAVRHVRPVPAPAPRPRPPFRGVRGACRAPRPGGLRIGRNGEGSQRLPGAHRVQLLRPRGEPGGRAVRGSRHRLGGFRPAGAGVDGAGRVRCRYHARSPGPSRPSAGGGAEAAVR